MTKTHKTAIVLIPPEKVWGPIQAIRSEHDRHFRRWMPHITLLYPFRERAEWDQALPALRLACATVGLFGVELATLSYFRHRSGCTLWLAPEPSAPLVALQAALQGVAPECDDVGRHRGGFTPHLSVGQARGRPDKLLASLRDQWTPLRFQASAVTLIWRNDPPDDVFRAGHRIPLGEMDPHGEPEGESVHIL